MEFSKDLPVCVDLDGTLIENDTTFMAMFRYVRQRYFNIIYLTIWVVQGLAHFKKMLFANVELQVACLPYNQKVLGELKKIKQNGNPIYLVTATDQKVAMQVAKYLSDIFDECYASDGVINLSNKAKADLLIKLFGKHGYVYFGNSRADLYVWQNAHTAVVVSSSRRLIKKAKKISNVAGVL